MILSDRAIREYLGRDLLIEPLTDLQIQPCSVDLRLASDFARHRVASQTVINTRHKPDETLEHFTIAAGKPLTLIPGEFVLARTVETVRLPPTLVGKLEGRSTLARDGITIHQTGGFIDPGFHGTIVLELQNVNSHPVALWPGDRVCQIVFYRLEGEVMRAYGTDGLGSKYQDQLTIAVGGLADVEKVEAG